MSVHITLNAALVSAEIRAQSHERKNAESLLPASLLSAFSFLGTQLPPSLLSPPLTSLTHVCLSFHKKCCFLIFYFSTDILFFEIIYAEYFNVANV